MQEQNSENSILLPHHEQQTLCTTRLPYRQGRKLTAVKVYSICKESNHLLIFGVPSLNLRQETKALFIKFGKLLQFNISKEHTSEPFTETYHAQYERIQSARQAKKMLDTKNFYGGLLHVCYAPEHEDVEETRQKLVQRQRDIIYRLRNLSKDQSNSTLDTGIKKCETDDLTSKSVTYEVSMPAEIVDEPIKLNMGVPNTIYNSREMKDSNKRCKLDNNRKSQTLLNSKRKKTSDNNSLEFNNATKSSSEVIYNYENNVTTGNIGNTVTDGNITKNITSGNHSNIEVVDCTGVEDEVITNINESLNYNKFGSEIIRKVPKKALNKIQFHINKKL